MNKKFDNNYKKYINIKFSKLLVIIAITLILITIFPITIFAVEKPQETKEIELNTQSSTSNEIEIFSKADILMDLSTGNVLYEKNSNEKLYPASTTKLMTAILTLENCQLTDVVTVDKKALNGIPRSYTVAALQANEQFTVDQLMHVLLIPSANDAANVLACHIAGSIDNFANMMNEKAKALGCKNTHFVNPSGVHNDDHYSTAYDMALIGKYAYQFDVIREFATITKYSLPNSPNGKERNFKATNTLITPGNKYYYDLATGLKTGYTDKAKSCIVATAEKDNKKLLCVVLGGDKNSDGKAQRELDCINLFNYGFDNFNYVDLCQKSATLDKTNIENIPQNLQNADIIYSDSLNLLAPNGIEIQPTYSWAENQELPIYKDTVVGTITYIVNNSTYTINLLASNDILPNNSKSINYLFYILLGVLVLLFFVTKKKKSKKKPKKIQYFKHSFY